MLDPQRELDFLIAQYEQCHEHLRWLHLRRDTMIGVYGAAMLAFFTFNPGRSSPTHVFVLAIITTIMGVFVGISTALVRANRTGTMIQAWIIEDRIRRGQQADRARAIRTAPAHFLAFGSELLTFLILQVILAANVAEIWYAAGDSQLLHVTAICAAAAALSQFIGCVAWLHRLDRQRRHGHLPARYLSLVTGWPEHEEKLPRAQASNEA